MAEVLPENQIERPASGGALDLVRAFGEAKSAYWLEIGFGAGEHLAHQAAVHPDIGMIGCEPYINGVAALVAEIEGRDLGNLRIWPDDARLILPHLPDAAFARVFLLYPDPWPKARHHKRRFVNADNLRQVARVMADGAEFRFASDHMDYVRWTLEAARREPALEWTARGPADWRNRPADGIETRYEAKSLTGAQGVYLAFRRRPRAASGGT